MYRAQWSSAASRIRIHSALACVNCISWLKCSVEFRKIRFKNPEWFGQKHSRLSLYFIFSSEPFWIFHILLFSSSFTFYFSQKISRALFGKYPLLCKKPLPIYWHFASSKCIYCSCTLFLIL